MEGTDLVQRRFCREYLYKGASFHHALQNMLFYSIIHYGDAYICSGIAHFVFLPGADDGGKLQPVHRWCFGQHGFQLTDVRYLGRDDTVHRSLDPYMGYKGTGVQALDADDVIGLEIFVQGALGLDTGELLFQVTADETPYLDAVGFDVAVLYAIVTDMDAVHDQDLPIVAWVCKHLLVARHTCVKTDLSGGGASFTKCFTMMNSSVLK